MPCFWTARSCLQHAHSLEEVVRRRSRDVPYLLGDAQDLQFIEDVGIEDVSSRLALATSQMDALHLALILLDSELEVDTRRTAAEELEEELEKPDVARFVEGVLYAHPLPREGDLSGARSSCTGRTARVQGMLRNLIDRLAALKPGEPVREALVAEVVTSADVLRIVDQAGALDAQAQVNPLTQALRRSLIAHAESFRPMGE